MRRSDSSPAQTRAFVALASVCVVVACAGSDALPPDPDTAGFEPPVAHRIAEARQAVLDAPRSGEAWGELGTVFFAHDMIQPAVASFRRAESLDPREFRWPYLLSIASIDRPDAGESLAALERAMAIRPDYAPGLLRLGETLLSVGRREEAESAFRRATELAPDSSHAWLGLGRIALADGRPDDARELLETAARHRKRHREVHAALAQVYRLTGDDERAARAAALAARSHGNTPFVDPVLASVRDVATSAVHLARRGHRLLENDELDDAIELLQLALDTRPEYVDVRLDLAAAMILSGREREGLDHLAEVERIAPGFVDTASLADELLAERRARVARRSEGSGSGSAPGNAR